LARARDAEHHQLALELRELRVPLLQRLLRRLASDALPLERRPGIGKSNPLLLKLLLSPLAGGTLLQEPVLRDGERRNLGVEGGIQLVGLLGPLLGRARPLLGLALLTLRPRSNEWSSRLSLRTAATSASQLDAWVRVLSRSRRACRSASSRSMRAVQTRSRVEECAASCLSHSWSWSRRASARYDSQLSGVPKASASASKALHRSRNWRSSALISSKAPYLLRARCSSSCRQQFEISERHAARVKA
jgi:hypothetical protein